MVKLSEDLNEHKLISLGIKSTARAIVLEGEDQPPQEAGFAAYRALVDTEKMRQDSDTVWLLDNPGQNLWYQDPLLLNLRH